VSLGANERLRQLLALVESGELQRARVGARTQSEWAVRCGMTVDQFRAVTKRARELGHDVPAWGDHAGHDFDFSDEEVTEPGIRILPWMGEPDIGKTDN
jgi:hypothetical protein